MDSSTFRKGAREWAEVVAGCLAVPLMVLLPQLLDAVCPLAVDVLGGLACLAFFGGGTAWLLTRR